MTIDYSDIRYLSQEDSLSPANFLRVSDLLFTRLIILKLRRFSILTVSFERSSLSQSVLSLSRSSSHHLSPVLRLRRSPSPRQDTSEFRWAQYQSI